jgi:Reverse transcriptase (RNA-dependent DNA polymerase)
MVFGLQGTPGTFSRMIAVDVAPMYRKFPPNRFKHYMDDCLVATAEGELTLHRKMNHRLLDIFEEHSYFLKPSKCEFEKTEIDFLGVRLGNGKITIDPSKIAGIKEWPRMLKSVKEVRSTLVTTYFSFSSFLMTQQTHVTMYYYFLTHSCDSLVQIRPEDSVSIFSCLLMITQHAY